MLVRITNLLFAAAFSLAAMVQFNDPDPWLWIPTYLVALACTIAFERGRLRFEFALGVTALALLWATTLVPTVVKHPPPVADVFGDVKMYAPGVEEARELGGLVLIAGWVGTLAWLSWRKRRSLPPAA